MMQGQQILPNADDARYSCCTSECWTYQVSLMVIFVLVCPLGAVGYAAKSEIREVAGKTGRTGLAARTLATSAFCCTSAFKVNLRLTIKVSLAG
jgi:hypothetical protein